jgi:hypothetical protein
VARRTAAMGVTTANVGDDGEDVVVVVVVVVGRGE